MHIKIFIMKNKLSFIMKCIGYIWGYIYTDKIKKKKEFIQSILYYGWIKHNFKHLGNVYFRLPAYIGGKQYIEIANGTCIGKRVMIQATAFYGDRVFNPQICIGKNCNIGDDSNIQCCNKIILGNGVRLGRKVMINDTSHGNFIREQLDVQPNLRPLESKGPIIIEDNVWIGEMSCILGNVHIGKGSIIGANSVVTKDIPPYSLVVGSPARVIKQYDS